MAHPFAPILFNGTDYPGIPRLWSWEVQIAGDREVLSAALEVCPHIPRCYIQARKDIDMDLVLQTAGDLLCERIQFFKGYYEVADLRTCLEKGFIPNLYWADEPAEAAQAIENGVLGLLTNDIGPIRKVVS